jgi:hypothetical protein
MKHKSSTAAKKKASPKKKTGPKKKAPTIYARIAAALAAVDALRAAPGAEAGTRAARGGGATEAAGAGPTSFPPVLAFMIAFCSAAEGRPVADTEILQNLRNVRRPDLNAAINDTYHIPAGVARYPSTRPNMALSVRGAAVDVRNDLAAKGVSVPL